MSDRFFGTRFGSAGASIGAFFLLFFASAGLAGAACIDPNTNTVDTEADCLFASGNDKECRLGLAVNFDGSGGPPPDPKRIECTDGDPCDADGFANGVCVFEVGACVNVGSCPAVNVDGLSLKKPSEKDAARVLKRPTARSDRSGLLNGFAAALPSGVETCTDDGIEIKVPLTGKVTGVCNGTTNKCTSQIECDDYCVLSPGKPKAKAILKIGVVDDNGRSLDSDVLKLTCLRADAGQGAEALQTADAGDLIGGTLAMGKVGDFMVRNGRVRAVARDAGRIHSLSLLHGGQIMDADIRRADPADDRDAWIGMQPGVHVTGTQATTSVVVQNDGTDGAAAIVRSNGPDDLFDVILSDVLIYETSSLLSLPLETVDPDLPLDLTTDLILQPLDNFVQIATKFENTSGTDLEIHVGDFMNPGGSLETFAPGMGFGSLQIRNGGSLSSGGQTLDYAAYQGVGIARGLAYGVVFPPTQPEFGSFRAETYDTGLFFAAGANVWAHNVDLLGLLFDDESNKEDGGFVVPANGENTLRRWFVIGESVADVTKAHLDIFGREHGAVQGRVTSGGEPVAFAHVALVNDNVHFASAPACQSASNCVNVAAAGVTDDDGYYRLYAEPGAYTIAAGATGVPFENSATAPDEKPITVKKKKTVTQNFELPSTGTLIVNIVDQGGSPIAGRISVVGIDDSPDPGALNVEGNLLPGIGNYFGEDVDNTGSLPDGLPYVFFADHSGSTGEVSVEPGDYHVVVSHGVEYDVFDVAVSVAGGATETINATVNHVIDTTGFVSIDTHVHMENSPDSVVPRADRIVTMLAEGVDFFTASDHGFVHDLEDDVAALGASALIKTAPSNEHTVSSYGHFNVWPLVPDPNDHAGGPVDWGRAGETPGMGYVSNGSYDLLPSELFANFNPSTQVIQINHISGSLFSQFGVDTLAVPPDTNNDVYRCVGGNRAGHPCNVSICSGGTGDGDTCVTAATCGGGACVGPGGGRSCGGGGTCTLTGDNASVYTRLDPSVANIYDDGYTALEVLIQVDRNQTADFLTDNLSDWAALLNQGQFKVGICDSDTHTAAKDPSGSPRTFVASATDDPASIDPATLATTVNDFRATCSGGPFVTVTTNGATSGGQALGSDVTVTSLGGGSDTIDIHVESPTWAEFDTIDVYVNTVPDCKSVWAPLGWINPSDCTIDPDFTFEAGSEFAISTTTGASGFGSRLEADITGHPLTITEDTWVIVVVRGTDGVSKPMFPMMPNSLAAAGNDTLAGLTDSGVSPPWNLGEQGTMAIAFTNPLFFDHGGDGFCHNGVACP